MLEKLDKTIDYLCIGHCCHDFTPQGYILGGSASYSALFAQGLGVNPAIVTSVGADFLYQCEFDKRSIPFINIPAAETTIFQNIYDAGTRIQYILAKANDLSYADIPSRYLDVPIIHLCSISNELSPSLFTNYRSSLIGATIQGMLRNWEVDGKIIFREMDWTLLKKVDIIVLGTEDIAGRVEMLDKIRENCKHVVVTNSDKGATVYEGTNQYWWPSYPIEETDATGAGDVFTSAYLIAYHRTKNIEESSIYAHCAASFVVQGFGVNRMPSQEELVDRIIHYKSLFTS